jgi:hypothetical protein
MMKMMMKKMKNPQQQLTSRVMAASQTTKLKDPTRLGDIERAQANVFPLRD